MPKIAVDSVKAIALSTIVAGLYMAKRSKNPAKTSADFSAQPTDNPLKTENVCLPKQDLVKQAARKSEINENQYSSENIVERLYNNFIKRKIITPEQEDLFYDFIYELIYETNNDKNLLKSYADMFMSINGYAVNIFLYGYNHDFKTFTKYADKIPDNVLEYAERTQRFDYLLKTFKELDEYEQLIQQTVPDYSWNDDAIKKLKNLKNVIYKDPSKYVNGDFSSLTAQRNSADEFFSRNEIALLPVLTVFDNETIDRLMKKRFQKVTQVINKIMLWKPADLVLLKKLCMCTNSDSGKPFTPEEKLNFINLVDIFCSENTTKYYNNLVEVTKNGEFSLKELQKDIMKTGLLWAAKTVSDKNFTNDDCEKWNLEYASTIIKEFNIFSDIDHTDLSNILLNAENFKNYIHDTSNIYGKTNALTMESFKQEGYDYEKWVSPKHELAKTFYRKNSGKSFTKTQSELLETYINALIDTPLQKYITRKLLPEFIDKDGYFHVPDDVQDNKELAKITHNIINRMEPVWKRAEQRADESKTAIHTLSVKKKLEHIYKQLTVFKNNKGINDIDLTIRAWDRNPYKDLFQGSYSTCCLELGGTKSEDILTYLLNTSLNMVEIVNNKTGKTIGNSLIYLAKDRDNNPIAIIDNVEINNSIKFNPEMSSEILMCLADYVSDLAKDVTGKELPVYIGAATPYNDLYIPLDAKKEHLNPRLVGHIHSLEGIFSDVYGYCTDFLTINSDRSGNIVRLK